MVCIVRFTSTHLYSLFVVCAFLCALSAAQWPRPQSGSPNLDAFRHNTLNAHNRLRGKHGSPPLQLSSDLNHHAQNYAEYLARNNKFEHSNGQLNGRPYGENLASRWGSNGVDYTGEEVSQAWYSEIKDYDFSSPGFSFSTGHFTQLVWKNTKELGVGKAWDSNGKVYVVAEYMPPGNYEGEFRENVLPPR